MPTIAFQSRIRTVSDNSALSLVVRHRLVAGEPSDTLQIMKISPPAVDIIPVSPLTISISATLNGRRIPLEQLILSRIAQYLPEYLRTVCIIRTLAYASTCLLLLRILGNSDWTLFLTFVLTRTLVYQLVLAAYR